MRKSCYSLFLTVLVFGSPALATTDDCTKNPDSLGCWADRQKNVQGMASTLNISCATTADAKGGGASCWHKGYGGTIESGRLAGDWTFSISNLKNPKKIELELSDIYILDDEGVKYVNLYETVYKQAKLPGAVVVPAVRLNQFTAPTDVSAQSRGVCAIDQGLLKCLLLDENFKDYGKSIPPVSSWAQMHTFEELKEPRSLVSANLSTLVIVDDGRVVEIETGYKMKVSEYLLPRDAKATELYGGGANFCIRMNTQSTERLKCDGDDRWRQVTNLPKDYETQKTIGVGLASDLIALETETGVVFSGITSYSETTKIPDVKFQSMRKLDGYGHYCLWHGLDESRLTCWDERR